MRCGVDVARRDARDAHAGALRFSKSPEELLAACERRIAERLKMGCQLDDSLLATYRLVADHIDSVVIARRMFDPDDPSYQREVPVVDLTLAELHFFFTPFQRPGL